MDFAQVLKNRSQEEWERGYNHPFVQQLGQGSLDPEIFKFYLIQDYFYNSYSFSLCLDLS